MSIEYAQTVFDNHYVLRDFRQFRCADAVGRAVFESDSTKIVDANRSSHRHLKNKVVSILGLAERQWYVTAYYEKNENPMHHIYWAFSKDRVTAVQIMWYLRNLEIAE